MEGDLRMVDWAGREDDVMASERRRRWCTEQVVEWERQHTSTTLPLAVVVAERGVAHLARGAATVMSPGVCSILLLLPCPSHALGCASGNQLGRVEPGAYYLRGEALYKTQNMDQAKKHFQEALRLNPDHAKAGTSFKRLRNIERAIEGGKAAADVRPLTPLLYWGGGQTAS
jgi:tetratricopeptide (TPR) repeat protein